MKKKIISTSLVTLGFLLGATALSAFADWSAPKNAPPTCNSGDPGCDAPLNVGPSNQKKLNGLKINTNLSAPDITGLEVWGKSIFHGGLTIADGTQGNTKVLTSDASGNATWATAPGTMKLYDTDTEVFHVDYTGTNAERKITGANGTITVPGAKAILLYGNLDDADDTAGPAFIMYQWPGKATWKYLVNSYGNALYPNSNSLWVPLDSNHQLNWRIGPGHLIQDYSIYIEGEID